MSGVIVIGLIVVVWLVVLAPLLLRSQKPISKAGEAFDDTRVILEGGSSMPMRRRPRLGSATDDIEEIEEVADLDEDYEIMDSPSIFRHRREETPEEVEETVEEGVEKPAVEAFDATEVVELDAEWNEEDHYANDDAYVTPLDHMHPAARAQALSEYEAEESDSSDEAPAELSEELTEEDMEFAERRRGRGYYDPEADREFAQSQYVRRQRTLLGLVAVLAVTLILGFVAGGWAWVLPGTIAAVTACYLAALRSQVRAENELRARRIRRLRRSRMGVRSSADLPQRLRRPGAVVLELDDESPDFEGLSYVSEPVANYDDEPTNLRHRRVS